eukprot:sb/3479584/
MDLVEEVTPRFPVWSVERIKHRLPSLHQLPDDALLEIFRYLPLATVGKCGEVCKRWNNLSKMALLSVHYLGLNADGSVTAECPKTVPLEEFCDGKTYTNYSIPPAKLSLPIAIGDFKCLTSLIFTKVEISTKFASTFSNNSPPFLETLKFTFCDSLTERRLKLILFDLPQLKELHFCSCHRFIGSSIVENLQGNPLRAVSLYHCNKVKQAVVTQIINTYQSTLEWLAVSPCTRDDGFGTSIPGKLPTLLPKLTELILEEQAFLLSNGKYHFEGVQKTLKLTPNLLKLSVRNPYEFRSVMKCVVKYCTRLTHLDVSRMERNTAPTSAWALIPRLKHLQVLRAPVVKPLIGRNYPAVDYVWLSRCETLRNVDLSNHDISDNAVEGLIKSNPDLEVLKLVGCRSLTGRFLESCRNIVRKEPKLLIQICTSNVDEEYLELCPSFIIVDRVPDKPVESDYSDWSDNGESDEGEREEEQCLIWSHVRHAATHVGRMTTNTRHPPVCLLRKSIDIPTQQGTEKLSRGELVVVVGNNGENKTISLYLNSTQNFSCSEKLLKSIPLELVDYLLPVVPSSKRLDAYAKLDRNLMLADLGSLLSIERGRSSAGCIGELRYKGEVKHRPGIWFGMKLVGGQSPIGDSDGSIDGSYYMDRCAANTVIFATIDELSIIKSESSNDAALSLLSNMGDMKDKSLSKASKTLPLMSRKSTNDNNNHMKDLLLGFFFGGSEEDLELSESEPSCHGNIPIDSEQCYHGYHGYVLCLVPVTRSVSPSKYLYSIPYRTISAPLYIISGGYNSPCSFSVGEEVVVLKNKLPATPGVVRAVFQDQKRKWLLGVELETPTGESDGSYRGQQLFNCLPKHAVFCEATEAVPRHYYQEPRLTPPPPYNPTKMDFEEAFRQQKGAPGSLSSTVERAGSSSLTNSMGSMSLVQVNTKMRVATPEPPVVDPDPSLEMGSMVQVSSKGVVHYGVIRWIGSLPSRRYTCAGLELEDDLSPPGNDGIYDGVRYFTCPPFRALFCYLHDCSRDRRFEEVPALPSRSSLEEVRYNFGPVESGRIEGKVDPPKSISANYIGRMRGIQGNRNSCYLDATLYAMFAFDSTMDYMLSSPLDTELRRDIQVRMREEVVNPLREGGFVGREHMRQLRDLLGRAGSLEGLQDEEKEPEELLSMLFTEIFCIKPLLSFRPTTAPRRDGNSNEISHVNLCQILLDRDPNSNTTMPNTQDLLTRYFVTNNLYFHSQPDLLLLQGERESYSLSASPRGRNIPGSFSWFLVPERTLSYTTLCSPAPNYSSGVCVEGCGVDVISVIGNRPLNVLSATLIRYGVFFKVRVVHRVFSQNLVDERGVPSRPLERFRKFPILERAGKAH